jgi:hypothetical protein
MVSVLLGANPDVTIARDVSRLRFYHWISDSNIAACELPLLVTLHHAVAIF